MNLPKFEELEHFAPPKTWAIQETEQFAPRQPRVRLEVVVCMQQQAARALELVLLAANTVPALEREAGVQEH